MDAIRAFIALELPDEIRQKIDEVSHALQDRCTELGGDKARHAVRWVPASNIHLTLKFLGEVSTANIQSIARMLKAEAATQPPFNVVVGGLGAFPNAKRPRVIWIGSHAPDNLLALQKAIESGSSALGYPTEDRPFSPHLTLGRVSQSAAPSDTAAVSQALSIVQVGELGHFQVTQIHLFRSDLKPGGAVYTSLYQFTLGK